MHWLVDRCLMHWLWLLVYRSGLRLWSRSEMMVLFTLNELVPFELVVLVGAHVVETIKSVGCTTLLHVGEAFIITISFVSDLR